MYNVQNTPKIYFWKCLLLAYILKARQPNSCFTTTTKICITYKYVLGGNKRLHLFSNLCLLCSRFTGSSTHFLLHSF